MCCRGGPKKDKKKKKFSYFSWHFLEEKDLKFWKQKEGSGRFSYGAGQASHILPVLESCFMCKPPVNKRRNPGHSSPFWFNRDIWNPSSVWGPQICPHWEQNQECSQESKKKMLNSFPALGPGEPNITTNPYIIWNCPKFINTIICCSQVPQSYGKI